MGRPEYPEEKIVPHLMSLLRPDALNVFTLHAELEGMGKRALFNEFLAAVGKAGVEVVSLEDAARDLLAAREKIPVCAINQAEIDGRSGLVAVQGPKA
ncbi:MAG: 4-deoxy-4-formamido-L-arabinose-phosphoundecaprenol deformylase, partial [Opitutus sp.]